MDKVKNTSRAQQAHSAPSVFRVPSLSPCDGNRSRAPYSPPDSDRLIDPNHHTPDR